jgi:hypothetical protein
MLDDRPDTTEGETRLIEINYDDRNFLPHGGYQLLAFHNASHGPDRSRDPPACRVQQGIVLLLELLEFMSAHRQSVSLLKHMVQLPVHTLHVGAGLPKVPMCLLKLPANVSKLFSEEIHLGA